jgi:hypothetical protein
MRRRRLPALAFLPIAAAAGCDDAGARAFAVTVREADALVCVPMGSAFDEEAQGARATAREAAYADEVARVPPRTVGRTLRVVEREGRVRAWLEGDGSTDFLGPEQVYEGPSHDEYIEGAYDRLELTAGDAEPLTTARAVLTVTADDLGLLGRVRWTDVDHAAREEGDAPDTRLECSRSLTIEGSELE